MGVSISWIAVKGMEKSVVLDCLGLELTSETNEDHLDGYWEKTCCYSEGIKGWRVVFYNGGCDRVDVYAKKLIAQAPEALICRAEEHVMHSSASKWNAGKKIWSVSHDSDDGIYDLKMEGEVPSELEEIHKKHKAEQDAEGGEEAGVDFIYNVPFDLAGAQVGFNHEDGFYESGVEAWVVCKILKPKKGCCVGPLILAGGLVGIGYLTASMS